MVVEIAEFMRINGMEMDFRSIPKFFVCRGEMFVESRSFFAFWDDKKKKKCFKTKRFLQTLVQNFLSRSTKVIETNLK